MSWDTIVDLLSLSPEQQDRILDEAALPPPNGIVPSLKNPPNGNTLCLVMITFCSSIVALVVALRAYARIFVVRKLSIEDGKPRSFLIMLVT